MNKRQLKKHMEWLRKSEAIIKERLRKEEEPTLREKVVGVILLLGFVALVFGGMWAAFTTGRPLIPYNPEVMEWSLPWWMVD